MTQIVYVTRRIKVMESKFYVSLEAARLLKEKGYNNYSTVYDCSVEGNILLNQEPMYGEWMRDKDVYPCPTKAETIDWLDSKEVYIKIGGVGSGKRQKWLYSVFDYKTCGNYESGYIFPTRLEAEDAAIIKALELLK